MSRSVRGATQCSLSSLCEQCVVKFEISQQDGDTHLGKDARTETSLTVSAVCVCVCVPTLQL